MKEGFRESGVLGYVSHFLFDDLLEIIQLFKDPVFCIMKSKRSVIGS
jgi:hypothetical protein